MTGIVQLVTQIGVLNPTLLARPLMRVFGIDSPGGVKITVRLLGACDLGNEAVEVSAQFRIGLNRQCIRRSFENLVWIGIIKGSSGRFMVGEFLAFECFGGALEIIHAPGFLALFLCKRDRYGAVGFDAGRPKYIT